MIKGSHYVTLNVSKNATHEEIKTAFRQLSLATHPDTSVVKGTDVVEKFKRISEAHSVLCSPTKRIQYDRHLQEQSMWKKPRAYGNAHHYGGESFDRSNVHSNRWPTQKGAHMLALGLGAGLLGLGLLSYFGGAQKQENRGYHAGSANMVEAWHNPSSGRWEQPAPWDPTYRKLKPALHLVPREKVERRNL
jgi:curved DNA-binding protein CbpA